MPLAASRQAVGLTGVWPNLTGHTAVSHAPSICTLLLAQIQSYLLAQVNTSMLLDVQATSQATVPGCAHVKGIPRCPLLLRSGRLRRPGTMPSTPPGRRLPS